MSSPLRDTAFAASYPSTRAPPFPLNRSCERLHPPTVTLLWKTNRISPLQPAARASRPHDSNRAWPTQPASREAICFAQPAPVRIPRLSLPVHRACLFSPASPQQSPPPSATEPPTQTWGAINLLVTHQLTIEHSLPNAHPSRSIHAPLSRKNGPASTSRSIQRELRQLATFIPPHFAHKKFSTCPSSLSALPQGTHRVFSSSLRSNFALPFSLHLSPPTSAPCFLIYIFILIFLSPVFPFAVPWPRRIATQLLNSPMSHPSPYRLYLGFSRGDWRMLLYRYVYGTLAVIAR